MLKNSRGAAPGWAWLAAVCLMLLPAFAAGNTIATSTMEFSGALTDNGDGTWTGVVPMVDGLGFDLYGAEGEDAWFGDGAPPGDVWTSQTMTGHDAWPAWDRDTPDWYQYSLYFYEDGGLQRWALRNHPGATADHPWYDEAEWGAGGAVPKGVPMSGVVNWGSMYAAETDVGAYLGGTLIAEIPGGAEAHGGGRGCWDMDWSWGSEVVPLEYIGFEIDITPDGGDFDVTLTPAPAPLNVDADWAAFVIRENATEGAPLIYGNSSYGVDAVEFAIFAASQKAGLGTDKINGATVESITGLHVDRLDDVDTSGSLYGPYFNIWITDGEGNYAVIANEPSNGVWVDHRWDVPDWDFLRDKVCKVYETEDAGTFASWVHVYADKVGSPLTFEDVAGLIIEPPSPAYIAASAFIGSGAPDELGTNIARGFNWMFGDTAANYVSGDGEGFVVYDYTATATFPVNNIDQGIGYATIQAAVSDANPYETIVADAGVYPEQVDVTVTGLTIRGAGATATLLKPGAFPVVTVSADGVILEDLGITDDTYVIEGVHVTATNGLTLTRVDFPNLGAGVGANAYGVNVASNLNGLIVDDCDFTAVPTDEYTRAIGIFAANNFQLGGFDVLGSRFEYLFTCIYLRSYIDGLDVVGNTFGPFELADGRACSAGLYIGDGTDDNFDIRNVTVSGNTFTDYTRGVYVWNYAANTTIGDFEISGNTFTNSIYSSAIRFILGYDDFDDYVIDGLVIDDNDFTQDSDIGANVGLVDLRTYDATLTACDLAVTNNRMTFSGAPYTDAMYGIRLMAGGYPFHGSTVISGNVLDGGGGGGAGLPASSGIVIPHYANGYTWPIALDVEIDDNSVTGFDIGVAVYDEVGSVYGGLPAGTSLDVTGNSISGNTFGARNDTGVALNAVGNWWGAGSGPYHPVANPLGAGNEVSDYVLFDPWMGMGTVSVTPESSGPMMCEHEAFLTVRVTTDTYTPDIFGFNAVVRAAPTGVVLWEAIGSDNPFGGTTQFMTFDQGDGSWIISGTTQGNPTQPISGAGTHDLFTIVFKSDSDGTADISFDSFTLRDPLNAPIGASVTGASIEVDCTPPAPVTGITAAPGHNKIDVSWTHDGTDVDNYRVFAGLWHDGTVGSSAYPEYDDNPSDMTPIRPADHAAALADDAWSGPTAVSSATEWTHGISDRGVYYYEVFAVDEAGNASPPAADDRATNYWLGDMNADGVVDAVNDISVLGAAFGTFQGHGLYNPLCDVGPTDDWSRLGIPLTDDFVNFEDLMIFSLNFGVVSAAKAEAPVATAIELAWVEAEDGRMALRLVSGEGLKGLNLKANTPVDGVVAGLLLDQQSEPTFLKNVGEKLDVSVAVMGVGVGFSGTGDLLIVSAAAPIDVEDLVIVARSIDNSDIEYTLDKASGVLAPRVFALHPNYPNPFNPMTKISFSLPEAQPVRLNVYGVDGRKVATLIDETREAGLHVITWTGRDDAGRPVPSGTYFLRIDAGPYSRSQKMMLLK